jgi:hypothetical protein
VITTKSLPPGLSLRAKKRLLRKEPVRDWRHMLEWLVPGVGVKSTTEEKKKQSKEQEKREEWAKFRVCVFEGVLIE